MTISTIFDKTFVFDSHLNSINKRREFQGVTHRPKKKKKLENVPFNFGDIAETRQGIGRPKKKARKEFGDLRLTLPITGRTR